MFPREAVMRSSCRVVPWNFACCLGVILIGFTACGGSKAGTAPDAGHSADAAANPDAGARSDGGDIAHAGDEDAGYLADAGVARDGAVVDAGAGDAGTRLPAAPRAVRVARATSIPACTVFVDVANDGAADGTAARPHRTLAAAIDAASNGAIVCVAEGVYAEALAPGTKYFTLAGGFEAKSDFKVRDSSRYVSKAQGDGSNTFLQIVDPGPTEGQLTAIDGFEITGYSQAIHRDIYYSQRFDITNNFIHDNVCAQDGLVGAGFSLGNVSGTISGNVIARNKCSRGGGGALGDSTNSNSVSITRNLVDANAGTEPVISHGGGLYLFANDLTLTANEFTGNTVTGWGGGLYVGAYTGGGQQTTARLSWNVYRGNRAGDAGGGFFCDDSAHCISDHEIYETNCGGNIFLDSGPDGADPTVATFDHLTSYRGLTVGCGAPGAGVPITKNNTASDSYSFTNAIFWGNAKGRDFDASCGSGCGNVTVSVTHSNVQTEYANGGIDISFGAGNLPGVDPLFVDADAHDFHLASTDGHWTPEGYVADSADSPALGAGDPTGPTGDNPERAGDRSEMGAYGNSVEASLVR